MKMALLVVAGYLLDGLIGDPRWLPHPVRGIGWLISQGEHRLNRGGPVARLLAGGVLTCSVVGVTALVAWGTVIGAGLIHPLVDDVVTVIGVGLLLARRSLAEEAGRAVCRPLLAGDLPAARRAVSWVVGRDTDGLDERGVARASIETLAENLSDGIVAPLLFALVGGLPGIALYKAINTLDSMIGHRDSRFLYFGRAAARLDDAANWLPARITLLALVAAAALLGRDASGAWRAALADGGAHASPNAGWPEAAMAGALSIRLGGLNYYDGQPAFGPVLNPEGRLPETTDIPGALALMQAASHLVLVAGVFLRALF